MTDQIPQWMLDHMEDDRNFQHKMMEEIIPTLATEKSVRELIHIQKNFIMAAELVRGGGKWIYRAIQVLAVIIGALAVITGAWKGIIAWALSRAI